MIYSKVNTDTLYTIFNGVWKRKLHTRVLKSIFIDNIICLVIGHFIFKYVEVDISMQNTVISYNLLLVMFLYFALSLTIFSSTIGQLIMRIKLVNRSGGDLKIYWRFLRGIFFVIELLFPVAFIVYLINSDAMFLSDYITKSHFSIRYDCVKYNENKNYTANQTESRIEKEVSLSSKPVVYRWYIIMFFVLYLLYANAFSLYRLFVLNVSSDAFLPDTVRVVLFIIAMAWLFAVLYLFARNLLSKANCNGKVELYSDFIRIYTNKQDYVDCHYADFYAVYGESAFGNVGKIVLSKKCHTSDMTSPVFSATLFELFTKNSNSNYVVINGVTDYKFVYAFLKKRIIQDGFSKKKKVAVSVKQDTFNTVINSILFFQFAMYIFIAICRNFVNIGY